MSTRACPRWPGFLLALFALDACSSHQDSAASGEGNQTEGAQGTVADMTISRGDLETALSQTDSSGRLLAFQNRVFNLDECAVQEGMIDIESFKKGMDPNTKQAVRKLMRFTSITPNVGDRALEFGAPSADPVDQNGKHLFQFSECHHHFHFTGYALYQLLDARNVDDAFVKDANGQIQKDADGQPIRKEVATGLKRAFCLEDFGHMGRDPGPRQRAQDARLLNVKQVFDPRTLVSGRLGEENRLSASDVDRLQRVADSQMVAMRKQALKPSPAHAADVPHTCDFQGIRAGFVDTYDAHLAGQWIDVTDLVAQVDAAEDAANQRGGGRGTFSRDFILRITINPRRITSITENVPDGDGGTVPKTLPYESNFANNISEVQITLPRAADFAPDQFKGVPDDN
jgi:hypothetical protein